MRRRRTTSTVSCFVAAWCVVWGCATAPAGDPVGYRLASHDGRVVMESSRGERLAFTCYGVSSEKQFDTWAAKQHVFLDAGVELFQLCVWPAADSYWSQPF